MNKYLDSIHDLLNTAMMSVPWLLSTLLNTTFVKSVLKLIFTTIFAFLQVSQQQLRITLRNPLQYMLTGIMFAITCFTIIGTQFISALLYLLHWQENDYELQDEQQVEEQPNQARIQARHRLPIANRAHCESCDNLDEQLLIIIYQRNTLSHIRFHVSETVLVEDEIPMPVTVNPIVENMIPQQTQTRLEVVPIQESSGIEMNN